MTERTLVLIKPDGVQRRLIGEVIARIERKGLSIAALELRDVGDELARKHHAEHEGKPFFDSLLEFITSGPVVAAIVEGYGDLDHTRLLKTVYEKYPGYAKNSRLTHLKPKQKRAKKE